MSFKDQKFASRFNAMGDEAEGVFEAAASTNFQRYGLNRPPISMALLPPMVRYTPDYLMHDRLVEVQGTGRDRTCKLKIDKFQALLQWDLYFPTNLFVWDNVAKAHSEFRITEFPVELAEMGAFPEGKPYFAVEVGVLPGEWVTHDA